MKVISKNLQMAIKINRKEGDFIKGVAIILIIFHNFFHWTKPFIGENEFYFNNSYFANYLNSFQYSISFFFRLSFAYFGHYGVQIFIFLSGYGLYKSQLNKSNSFILFIKKRFIKIYPVFILATILALFTNHFSGNYQLSLKSLASFILRLTPIVNFIPIKALNISGPFWFYSMIIQLYLLFIPLIYFKKRNILYPTIFVLFCFIITITTNNYFYSNGVSLYYTFIGNISVFFLGIISASLPITFIFSNIWKRLLTYIFALIIFYWGQKNEYIWHFTQVSFLILILPILKFLSNLDIKFVNFIGKYSMYLFACSGFLRQPWVKLYNTSTDSFSKSLFLLAYFISVALVCKILVLLEKQILKINILR